MQWVGDVDVDMLKEGVLHISKVVEDLNCPAVLSDRRIAQGNWFAINNWLEHKWAPIATKAGLQYLAHVRAPQATSQLSSQDMESRLLGFTFKSFSSIEQAELWLHEMLD